MDAKEFKETIYEIAILVIALIAWVAGTILVSYGINLSGLFEFWFVIDFVLFVVLLLGFFYTVQGIYVLVMKAEDPEEEDSPKE